MWMILLCGSGSAMVAYPRSVPMIWPYDSVVVANQRKPMSGRMLAPERLIAVLVGLLSMLLCHISITYSGYSKNIGMDSSFRLSIQT